MKRMTNNMMTAAAVLMIGAGVASAQTTMKAEIPFAFSAGRQVTEPGKYDVKILRGSSTVQAFGLYNQTTSRGSMVTAILQSEPPKNWKAAGTPRAAFDCSSGVCALRKIWFGEGNAYEFSGPKTKSGEVQLTEVLLTPNPKGD